jgi:plasmid stabilization system protein ParE
MPDLAIRITRGAEDDLRGIYRRHLALRGADGDTGADALLDRLVQAIEGLATFPERGPMPPELEVLGIHDYHQLSHPPYRIIYLPELHGADPRVTVMLIADSRRDVRVLLEERLLRR